jgi:hypothetical protein
MLGWDQGGGVSVDVAVRVPARYQAGLEWLIRDCAQPIFAGERLAWLEPDQRQVDHLSKPRPDRDAAGISG